MGVLDLENLANDFVTYLKILRGCVLDLVIWLMGY